MKSKPKHIVVLSDTHFGSAVALSQIHQLDDGGYFHPSKLQAKLYRLWLAFWEWTYAHIGKDQFILVHVGDVIDGVHHRTTALSSHNLTIQSRLAIDMLMPHVTRAQKYFQIRGTEAHVGQSAQEEEAVAAALGAEKDPEIGAFSRWELWMKFGDALIHFAHHVGSTSSSAYESSALMREMVAAFVESGQWGMRAPGIVIRAHTHRYLRIEGVGQTEGWQAVKLPGWQAKTPFVYKMDRLRGPMFGGILLTDTAEGVLIRKWVQTVKMTKSITI